MQSENEYLHYSEIDFATDEHFIEWVKRGDATAAAFWQDFLSRYPEREATILQAKRLLSAVRFEEAEWSETDMYLLKQRIMSTMLTAPSAKSTTLRPYLISFARVAAVVAILLTGTYLWISRSPRENNGISYTTGVEAVKVINLPDSSRVIMNSNSKLSYRYNSDTRTREAVLTGEAYFDVRKNPSNPFTVKFKSITLQVLGTAFSVQSGKDSTIIALESGKVRLLMPGRGEDDKRPAYMDMQPGQVVVYAEASGNLVRRIEEAEQYTSWKDAVMNFDQASLEEVAEGVRQLYDIRFVFPGDMVKQTFSTDVVIKSNDVSLLIRLLEASFVLTSERKGDSVIFSRK